MLTFWFTFLFCEHSARGLEITTLAGDLNRRHKQCLWWLVGGDMTMIRSVDYDQLHCKKWHIVDSPFYFWGYSVSEVHENALDRRIKSPTIGGCGGIWGGERGWQWLDYGWWSFKPCNSRQTRYSPLIPIWQSDLMPPLVLPIIAARIIIRWMS